MRVYISFVPSEVHNVDLSLYLLAKISKNNLFIFPFSEIFSRKRLTKLDLYAIIIPVLEFCH